MFLPIFLGILGKTNNNFENMTTLTPSQIPTNVDTAERLCAYAGLLLQRVNPDTPIQEEQAVRQKAIEAVIISDAFGSPRLVLRISLPLSPDYATDTTTPFYAKALEISNAPGRSADTR